jgi:hypothetical protein
VGVVVEVEATTNTRISPTTTSNLEVVAGHHRIQINRNKRVEMAGEAILIKVTWVDKGTLTRLLKVENQTRTTSNRTLVTMNMKLVHLLPTQIRGNKPINIDI